VGVLGTANRRFFHGPGLNNWNLSLHKLTQISERTCIEIRGEFFNVFDRAQFMNPTGNFAAAGFGRVTSARDPRIGQVALKITAEIYVLLVRNWGALFSAKCGGHPRGRTPRRCKGISWERHPASFYAHIVDMLAGWYP
jgi:hypothetical protein